MNSSKPHGFLYYAGKRTITASLLPALAGTTLPFWLQPPEFAFRWGPALWFMVATVLFHAGFSFFHAALSGQADKIWTKQMLIRLGTLFLLLGIVIGLRLNYVFRPGNHVYPHIFLLYGLLVLFSGALYLFPPVRFYRYPFGEVILCEGLGMLPLLGAYLVQAGDLTRTVYIASMPLVVSTWLWVWLYEYVHRKEDRKRGIRNLVMQFPDRISGRYIPSLLTGMVYLTLVAALVVRGSVHPFSLIGLVSLIFGIKIIYISWYDYADDAKMAGLIRQAFLVHLVLSLGLILTALIPLFF